MATVTNGVYPSLMTLEGREQPGSMFSTGLDASLLARAFGEEILKASRPAQVNNQVPQKIDSTEITLRASLLPLSVQAESTIIQQAETQSIQAIDGLSDRRIFASIGEYARFNPHVAQRPADFDGSRGVDLLNYNGDLDGIGGLSNEFNTNVSDSRTFDGFRIRGSQIKDCFFSHNLANHMVTSTVNVTVLGPGFVTPNIPNGGLPIAYQAFALKSTHTPTGLEQYGLTEYEDKVCGLGLALPSGHYYVNVQPIGDGTGQSWNSTATGTAQEGSGQNGTVGGPKKGGPAGVGDSYLDSPYWGYVFEPAENLEGVKTDFSMGVCRAPGC